MSRRTWTQDEAGLFRSGRSWRARLRFRVQGRTHVLQRTVEEGGRRAAVRGLAELRVEAEAVRKGSLTARQIDYRTFGQLVDFYLDRRKPKGMVTIFGVLRRDLGNVTIQELPDRFDRFLQLMRTTNVKYTDHPPSEVTINRYIGCARTVCRYAAKMAAVTGVRGNPLSGFSCTTEQGRDRIWTTEEKERIFRTMTELGSYLYWPVYFCQWNPIRRGDLFKLTRDNLDRQNKRIHFYPSKTRGKVNRETYLPFIDTALWGYFDSLPADCPYLFPKLHEDGTWEQVRDPDTHWHTVLARTEVQDDGGKVVQAAVSDLHFHDVSKHVPISWMMDNGYSEVDIKALGIQYTHEMVMRYAHRDASAVADRWQASQAQVVGSIGIGVKVA